MKTLKILNTLLNVYNEADATIPQPEGDSKLPPGFSKQTEEQPTPPVATSTLSPESEVMLVRLLKKGLVMDLDENDLNAIDQLGEINENTCKEALQKLLTIMQNYSEDANIKL